MNHRPARLRVPGRVLLLGGGSEIGREILLALDLPPGCEVVLAGRDEQRMAVAGADLPFRVRTAYYDATALESHQRFVDEVFAAGPVDLVVSAAGVLIDQELLDQDPLRAGLLVETNLTGHVTTLLAVAQHLRRQRQGMIVVLSSVAAVRPRKANYVYGAAKAGLDAFARGLADSLHGSGVRLLLVRPGFVIGRMTAGMAPAPASTTAAAVGAAVAAALANCSTVVWVPRSMGVLAGVMRLIPRPLWRKLPR
ncbi:decaprenylphospho-beta-D-erythro-pentofuranosid-2-ulose 2-reductase [Kitasatospora sp. MAP12-15]|uniref:SDR family NAD(P)-dependent oxidoreductase n=1 Tax=unclassified Kitasatospora TaxID=2633591 RepID=UPI002475150A|nr:SDR family NAD(P)-dependent oxidoreductase [Kitasatospora sp. MAP12-44]MDH6112588.1 decaprenylphospho-beta-D-erythro-pentofuranosid-2-ulose 2-reductase [Kitasatospora sp. MAP12-44]